MEERSSVSLNKYISSTGLCSRREADTMISAGRVKINGKRAQLGNRVFETDKVTIDGDEIENSVTPTYIAYNKPVGVVSTTDSKEKQNISKYINHEERLFPVGRLDKDSEGLIFLTNDGDIVNKILRAGNKHQKEYIVTVNQVITPKFVQQMSKGVPILGTTTQKCEVTKIDDYRFSIVLTEGMNRQIRRMCQYLKYDVAKLIRVRIMNIELGKLKTGHWRVLNPEEVRTIKSLVKDSRKTASSKRLKNKKHGISKRIKKKSDGPSSSVPRNGKSKINSKKNVGKKKSYSSKSKPNSRSRKRR